MDETAPQPRASTVEPSSVVAPTQPSNSVQRYAIWVEYVGTAFHGSQRQQEEPTVQSDLEAALWRLSPTQAEPPRVVLCGRTDAGVHAIASCAHFDLHLSLIHI